MRYLIFLLLTLVSPKSYPVKEAFYINDFRLYYSKGYILRFNVVDNEEKFSSLDIYIDGKKFAHYGFITEVSLRINEYADNNIHHFEIIENTSSTPNKTDFKLQIPSGDIYLDNYEFSVGDFIKEYDPLVIRKKEAQYLKFESLEYENKQTKFAYVDLKALGRLKFDEVFNLGKISINLANDSLFAYLSPYYLNFNLAVKNNYLVLDDSYFLNKFSNQIIDGNEKDIDKIYLPKKLNTRLLYIEINIEKLYGTDINLHMKTFINLNNTFDDCYEIVTKDNAPNNYDYEYSL